MLVAQCQMYGNPLGTVHTLLALFEAKTNSVDHCTVLEAPDFT